MRFVSYFKYFFYIAFNWNIFIAVLIIYHEIRGERKYNINTIGIDDLSALDEIDTEHATIYMPAIYSVLELVFQKLNVSKVNHLLDIGSGKGRVVCVAGAKGCKKVTGIEISKALCMDAIQNLTIIQQEHPSLVAKVILKNVVQYKIPEDVDCIFLFNPFDEYLMEKVVNNIQQSIKLQPRPISIIYANPIYKSLFINAGFKESFHYQKMKYIEVSIFE